MSRPLRRAVLLLNVGSPEAPRVPEVRRYLEQFLSDPRVVDIPWLPRQLLLRAVILPFRPKRSAAAYKLVWTAQGSPLVTISKAQAAGLERRLGLPVLLAMRYGEPSLSAALATIVQQQIEELVVVPLFPQYSSAATGSALQAVYAGLGAQPFVPAIQVLRPFWDDPAVLDAFAARVREALGETPVDALLCSFHGLPERQVKNTDAAGGCLSRAGCCEDPGARLAFCYRAQCYATAAALGERLGLRVITGFQSRLGRTPWIKPYTDELLPVLAQQGKKRLMVLCPAFVADCLETIEEIGMRAKEQWRELGGEELLLVPSLNAEPAWIEAVAGMVRAQAAPATI